MATTLAEPLEGEAGSRLGARHGPNLSPPRSAPAVGVIAMGLLGVRVCSVWAVSGQKLQRVGQNIGHGFDRLDRPFR